MAEYSDSESVSESESESEGEGVEVVLKKVAKALVPVIKAKRTYQRKTPISEDKQKLIVDKLQKARDAKSAKSAVKKQEIAQEIAELKELKSLKDEGKLKIKKEKDKPVKESRQRVVKEIHHYHNEAPAVAKPVAKTKRVAEPVLIKKMIFA